MRDLSIGSAKAVIETMTIKNEKDQRPERHHVASYIVLRGVAIMQQGAHRTFTNTRVETASRTSDNSRPVGR
jgi:hypothetical protein